MHQSLKSPSFHTEKKPRASSSETPTPYSRLCIDLYTHQPWISSSPALAALWMRNHTYPSTGQTRIRKRHGPILDSAVRQTSHHRTITHQLPTGRRHKHDGTLARDHTLCCVQAAIPIRHARRAWQPDGDPQGPPRNVPLYVSDPPPQIQHPVVLPVHDPAARRHDGLLQLPGRRSGLRRAAPPVRLFARGRPDRAQVCGRKGHGFKRPGEWAHGRRGNLRHRCG